MYYVITLVIIVIKVSALVNIMVILVIAIATGRNVYTVIISIKILCKLF